MFSRAAAAIVLKYIQREKVKADLINGLYLWIIFEKPLNLLPESHKRRNTINEKTFNTCN